MRITRNIKMADVIHIDHWLLTVLNRFDISLGFGEKKVDEVCEIHGVDVDFFLEIANAYHDEHYFPRTHLQTYPVQMLVSYLKSTHEDYLTQIIPQIEEKISALISFYSNEGKNMSILQKFFLEYKKELSIHIQREEDRVFPYVLEIGKAHEALQLPQALYEQINRYSIHDYFKEHDDVEEKLYDLKNILLKYLPQGRISLLQQELINALFGLEKDLNNHSRIEDKVLVNKVAIMERELLTLYQSKL